MRKYLALDYFPGFRSMKKHVFCCLEMKRNLNQKVSWELGIQGKLHFVRRVFRNIKWADLGLGKFGEERKIGYTGVLEEFEPLGKI
jgi:hypothetical protein